jgi:hypothetical protein
MLGFAHPAMLLKDAEAFTVAYPWAKPPCGWLGQPRPERLGASVFRGHYHAAPE